MTTFIYYSDRDVHLAARGGANKVAALGQLPLAKGDTAPIYKVYSILLYIRYSVQTGLPKRQSLFLFYQLINLLKRILNSADFINNALFHCLLAYKNSSQILCQHSGV